jgi:hypothetical protein
MIAIFFDSTLKHHGRLLLLINRLRKVVSLFELIAIHSGVSCRRKMKIGVRVNGGGRAQMSSGDVTQDNVSIRAGSSTANGIVPMGLTKKAYSSEPYLIEI